MDRRTKTYKQLVNLTPPSSELLSEEIDGAQYGYHREARCKVCNSDSDVRDLIDTLLLFPKTYREVLRLVTPLLDSKQVPENRRPTYASIRVHQQRHLPFDKLAVREVVERRAKEKGRAILNGTERLLTAEAFFEVIAQKSWDRLISGSSIPTLAEGMSAMKVLSDLEKESNNAVDMNRVLVQLNIVLEIIRQESSPEIWAKIVKRLEQVETEKPPVELVSLSEIPDNELGYPEEEVS